MSSHFRQISEIEHPERAQWDSGYLGVYTPRADVWREQDEVQPGGVRRDTRSAVGSRDDVQPTGNVPEPASPPGSS